jgi:hypothetical protein
VDIDFFSISLTTSTWIFVTPFNVGNNQGANLDVLVKIYDHSGKLMLIINDPLLITASTLLLPGNYYISVEATGNVYAPIYGMMGEYAITTSTLL